MATSPAPIQFVDVCSFINRQGSAYDLNLGVDSLLDLSREIQYSGKYYPLIVPFPAGADTTFGPYRSLSGVLAVQSFCYLVSIGGYSSNEEGFSFKLYDKGAKTDMIYRTFALDRNIASYGELSPGQVAGNPFGPYYLMSPFPVMPPGTLQVEVSSRSATDATIQVAFAFAIPISDKSISAVRISPAVG